MIDNVEDPKGLRKKQAGTEQDHELHGGIESGVSTHDTDARSFPSIDLELIAGMACLCIPGGACVGINRAWSDFTGRTIEQERDGAWFDGIHPDDQPRIRLAQQNATTVMHGFQARFRYKRADDGYTRVSGTALPIRACDGVFTGFIVTLADISDHQARRAGENPYDPSISRRESDHRLKNLLMEIEALTDLYAASGGDTRKVSSAIRGKLATIRMVHELVSRSDSQLVSFLDITTKLIEASRDKWADTEPISGDRINMDGPAFYLPAKLASRLAMCLHELLVNSRKHGALRSDHGTVQLGWRIENLDHPSPTVKMTWEETGGPTRSEPLVSGVGLTLIKGLATSDLRGYFDMALKPTGFCGTLTAQVAGLTIVPA